MTVYSDPDDVLEAALYYAQCGLSVLPIQRGGKGKDAGKRPPTGFKWTNGAKNLQVQIATEQEIRSWFSSGPINIGIICGEVSNHLVVWDIDLPDFARWIEPILAKLGTWVTRTGRSGGGFHVYFYTSDARFNSIPKPVGRAKGNDIADIKAQGGYVVAPPSLHQGGQLYTTVFGDPAHIRRVSNLAEALEGYRLRYLRAIHGINDTQIRSKSSYANNAIMLPSQGSSFKTLRTKIMARGIKPVIRQAIMNGATPGIDEWHKCSTHSEIDYAICAALLRLKWGRDTIEEVFATFPIGEGCYRNRNRPNHGSGYIERTIDNVQIALSEYEEARSQDMGLNFRISEVRLLSMDMSVYELIVEANGYEAEVQVTYEQLFMQNRCVQAIGNVLNIMPRLHPDYQGKNWPNFVDAITKLAQREMVPLAATNLGQLRQGIITELKRPSALLPNIPDSENYAALGFRDPGRDRVLFNGSRLIRRLDLVSRNTVEPAQIWQILRKLGAAQTRIRYPISRTTENLWVVPDSILNLTS